MDEEQIFKVRDLGLAAALVSSDHDVCATNRDKSGRAHFVFIHSEKLEQTINEYWADKLEVKARKYFDNIKMLKSRIYSEH